MKAARNTLFVLFIGLVVLTSVSFSRAAEESADRLSRDVSLLPEIYRKDVARALTSAGDNQTQLLSAIEAVKPEHRIAIAFLIANMPQRDLNSLTKEFLVEDITLAYQARESSGWAKAIPEDLFLNDVLPYANLNETRDSWRKDLFERFAPQVKACKTPGEAAIKLNSLIFDVLNVHYHATKRPKPDQSPAESMKATYASCSGLSILLVDACRAVGVPARAAGTPAWTIPQGDKNGNHAGNHTWAEVWDGQWHFLGACENSKLSETWFASNAARADDGKLENRIYAASFKKTDVYFPLVWDMSIRYVSADDVTAFYTSRRTVQLKVKGEDAANHVTVRLAGKIVADLDVQSAATLTLAAGKTYQATITQAGAAVPVKQDFAVGDAKDQVITLAGK